MPRLLRISEATSLALHTMVLLAANQERLRSTKAIASALDVSEAHLAKVLQRLARVGLVRSTRGPNGGFALDSHPDEVTLLEVYEAIEGPLVPTDCLLAVPVCGDNGCILGDLLETVNKQVKDYLAGTTLSRLADKYRRKDGEGQDDRQD